MKTGIYKITNLINNKIYIGQAVDLRVRIRTHEKYDTPEKYNGSLSFENEKNMPIHLAIMKYHLCNFKIEIIEECKQSELNEKEKYWISYYDCKVPKGYNLTDGGQGNCYLSGENNHFNKYKKETIDEIKKMLKEGKTYNEIFSAYPEVNKSSIYSINLGKSWKDENETYPLNNKFKNSKFTIEQQENIVNEFLQNYKNFGKMYIYELLAKKYNCSMRTIMNIVKNWGK